MPLNKSKTELQVYSEGNRKRIFVGTLKHLEEDTFHFKYSRDYLSSKGAIQLGPDLPLTKIEHKTVGPKVFSSFEDRIPSQANPAYAEYCQAYDISPQETNSILLLTTIGRRGPSTFVFEPVYITGENLTKDALRKFRVTNKISLRIMAEAFNLNYLTLQRIEKGTSKDRNTIRLVFLYLNFPDVAIWAVTINAAKIPQKTVSKLLAYFRNMKD